MPTPRTVTETLNPNKQMPAHWSVIPTLNFFFFLQNYNLPQVQNMIRTVQLTTRWIYYSCLNFTHNIPNENCENMQIVPQISVMIDELVSASMKVEENTSKERNEESLASTSRFKGNRVCIFFMN